MTTNSGIKNFLEISYEQLEDLNLEAKARQLSGASDSDLQDYYIRYLRETKELKAVTVGFSDLEGRFHRLDYDKKFLIDAHDNLTFDGSSIRGFSAQAESDLRLAIDWGSFRWLPSDVFGPGKVMVCATVRDRDGSLYQADMRGRLKELGERLKASQGLTVNISAEVEGFLFKGTHAEQQYNSREGFSFVSSGGYYHELPQSPLRIFIDRFAEAQRAMAFENEKDHPEVAPSQFELNYKYTDALIAADQIQIYKLLARQIATTMGLTASFLPKPVARVNGSGMHTNISVSKGGKNLFYDKNGADGLSEYAWDWVDRILLNANDLCLVLNPSVNGYRRLDPHYEAPNQIKSSAVDRGSMIRIPIANERSSRIEVRSVGPDANPYLCFYSLIRTGMEGPKSEQLTNENRRTRTKFLPDNITDGIRLFKSSNYMSEMLGETVHGKYAEVKLASANRCPKELGSLVKTSEIIFHHEVTNQWLWSRF